MARSCLESGQRQAIRLLLIYLLEDTKSHKGFPELISFVHLAGLHGKWGSAVNVVYAIHPRGVLLQVKLLLLHAISRPRGFANVIDAFS